MCGNSGVRCVVEKKRGSVCPGHVGRGRFAMLLIDIERITILCAVLFDLFSRRQWI
ncbi:hypothetical protein BVI2075_350046 [Burkholderia vietnamiensis]|nr:hypothetical protein BVI2075_350046 [Burkholderia vietnamiensis]